MLRATDLLAVDSAYRFYVLLAEVDALGAAVLKRRALRALENPDALATNRAKRAMLEHRAGDARAAEAALAEVERIVVELGAGPGSQLGRTLAEARATLRGERDPEPR